MSSSPTSATAATHTSSKPASPTTSTTHPDGAVPASGLHQQPQAAELGVYVDTLIKQLQSKFDDMSGHIISKIDTMADRLDDLEKSIAELMQNAEAAAALPEAVGSNHSSRPGSVAGGAGGP